MLSRPASKIALAENGQRLCVIRPAQPTLALSLAKVAVDHQDTSLFARLPEEVGDYTFVGWLASDYKHIVDENGKRLGDLKPGDSLVTFDESLTSS